MIEQDHHDFDQALDALARVLDALIRDAETKGAYFAALKPYRLESVLDAMNWLGANFMPTRFNRFPVPALIAERINSADKPNTQQSPMHFERRMNLETYLSELPADHPDHKFWAKIRAFDPSPKKADHRSSPKSLAQIIL